MKIVLKPLGALVVISTIATLSVMAFRGSQQPPLGTPGSSLKAGLNSTNVQSSNAAPLTPSPLSNAWKISGSGNSVKRATFGESERMFSLPGTVVQLPAGAKQGEFSAKVRCAELGKISAFPKYGIRLNGQTPQEYLELWIDPPAGVMATVGMVNGVKQDWRNTPLPPGFDRERDHELKMQWSDDRRAWQFTIDGDTTSSQEDRYPLPFAIQSAALVVEDARPVYTEITVK